MKKPQQILGFHAISAERVGFEPTIRLLVYKLSRLARSTTLTPLRGLGKFDKGCKYINFSLW